MNINDKFFSFPPHLSTPWDNVVALSLNPSGQIVFHLISTDSVTLPLLSKEETDRVFLAHAHFLEEQVLKTPLQKKEKLQLLPNKDTPIRFAFGTLEGLNSAMQHNPKESNNPTLPDEMILKVAEISRILAPSDPDQLPKAEPHCNCYHCQIARAVQGLPPINSTELEEEIPLTELEFQQWDIKQTGDKLFNVTNKLDTLESYSVYLGNPVGCTCGKEGCEHILEVLKS